MLPLQWTAFRTPAFLLKVLRVLRPGDVVLVSLRLAFGAMSLSALPLTLFHLPFQRAIGFPVPGSRANFEFVQLVPFLIGPVPLRNGKQFADPTTHIVWLHIIHTRIMDHTSVIVQPFGPCLRSLCLLDKPGNRKNRKVRSGERCFSTIIESF